MNKEEVFKMMQNKNVHIDNMKPLGKRRKIIPKNALLAKNIINYNITVSDYVKTFIDKSIDLSKSTRCCCPMHHETQPSFTYHMETNSWYCYGACRIGGDVVNLHKSYLAYLLKSGMYKRYKELCKIEPSELNYFTALEDLCSKYDFDTPTIFADEKTKSEEIQLNLTDFDKDNTLQLSYTNTFSSNYLDSLIEGRLRLLKTKETEIYKHYARQKDIILTTLIDKDLNIALLDLKNEIMEFTL